MIWTDWLESLLGAGAGGLAFSTRAELSAHLAFPEGVTALVYGDAAGLNGQYAKAGASGTGSWTRIGDLPTSMLRLTVTGGTANAIQVSAPETPTVPVPIQPAR